MLTTYLLIVALLFCAELVFFKIADRLNIIDKPNERSSHSTIVLRGGGVLFSLAMLVWIGLQGVHGNWSAVLGYLPFLAGLTLISVVSFWDDIYSLPDSVRLVAQFIAMGMMFWNLGLFSVEGLGLSLESQWGGVALMILIVMVAAIVFVGATNIINFMDGINGITAGYSLSVLLPLFVLNNRGGGSFILNSLLGVTILSVLVFSFFNFRPKGKAKCFAGDVGSIGIAFILLFAIGKLILHSGDVTWLIFLIVYGIDGCMTILHRIMLHENLGQAHRKHAYQLMANELGMSHVAVSLIYMGLQLAISLVMVFLIPDYPAWHWGYLIAVAALLALAYLLFMNKYYHLHQEYLDRLK